MGVQDNNLTGLLERAAAGDALANDALFEKIYPTLRKIARRQLRQHRQGTLCTTDLVHETSLRLFGQEKLRRLDGREHLFATAARAMRHVLVDYARQRSSVKRGGEWQKVSLQENQLALEALTDQVLALEDAMAALERVDSRSHQIAELKFFGGCTIDEIARYLDISDMTVKRGWRSARAFLYAELEK